MNGSWLTCWGSGGPHGSLNCMAIRGLESAISWWEEEGVRIAASADLHFTPQSYARLKDQFERVREEADVLVLAGDLTNNGQPEEMEPLLNVLVRLRLPTVDVLGNHDYESGKEDELRKMMIAGGIK